MIAIRKLSHNVELQDTHINQIPYSNIGNIESDINYLSNLDRRYIKHFFLSIYNRH